MRRAGLSGGGEQDSVEGVKPEVVDEGVEEEIIEWSGAIPTRT